MKRVTGIGGIFIKAENPAALRAWYERHLDIKAADWGGQVFSWRSADNPEGIGSTVWSVFEETSGYFNPSKA